MEAKSWVGTPFHHQGRKKGLGVDCIGLIVGVANELGIKCEGGKLSTYDSTDYSNHPAPGQLESVMDKYFNKITKQELLDGDILMFRIKKYPQHVGFFVKLNDGRDGIIHAHRNPDKVVEHGLNNSWWNMFVQAYRFKDSRLKSNG